ncbi:hypothetical protein AW27_023115 [Streptomyces sp. PCS3-D2]|uniref:hypothetical protein n=1 Tax=Streptomyces sp. PCS3-D2 TaxID=1460244 RepID=UPI00272D8C22|nr:hypothetical protein [Streptomyces sp. PCS3-D2]WKV74136.1 hypothetical protein AW27_023115 [Streptomyces sp. PCS3-D2]
MGRKEIAHVYNIAPTAVSDRWIPRGTLSYEDAVIVSGKPFWPGGLVVDLALPAGGRGRQLDVGRLETIEQAQGAGVRPKSKGELPCVVGLQEVAEVFGVDPVKASQATKSAQGMLPPADYELSGSPLWLLETILAGAEHTEQVSKDAKRNPGEWKLRAEVVEDLKTGRYAGPGSMIKERGKKAAEGGAAPVDS